MFERVLARMRRCVRARAYVVTVHAAEEMDDDELTVSDLESIILSGRIVERQIDRATRERKYVVEGSDLGGESCGVIGKFAVTGTLVIITVFRA